MRTRVWERWATRPSWRDGSGHPPDRSPRRVWHRANGCAITLPGSLPYITQSHRKERGAVRVPLELRPGSVRRRPMRALGCCVMLGLLLPVAAWAGEHDKEAQAAAQVSPQSRLIGFEASIAFAIQHETRCECDPSLSAYVPAKKRPWEVVLDMSGHSGRHDDESDQDPETTLNRTQYLPLVGLRYARDMAPRKPTATVPNPPNRLSLFGQVLAGGVFTKDDEDWRSGWAAGGGLGLDYLYSHYGGLRVQFDIIGAERHKPVKRISLGLVYRFEH